MLSERSTNQIFVPEDIIIIDNIIITNYDKSS